MDFSEVEPTAEGIIALSPAELGRRMVPFLVKWPKGRAFSLAELKASVAGDEPNAFPMGSYARQHRVAIRQALTESWEWLRNQGYLVPDDERMGGLKLSRQALTQQDLTPEQSISEAGRRERFARWETIGLNDIKDDLRHGGVRFVGGPPEVQQLAREWVQMKEEQAKNYPPRPPTYSRQTVIAAADMLKTLGHSGFDRFLLELELPDNQVGRGSGLLARATSLAEYAVKNPAQPTPERLTVPFAIIKRATDLWREGSVYNLGNKERERFEEAMKREGHGLALQVGHDNLPNSIVEQALMANENMSGSEFFKTALEASLVTSATQREKQRKAFIVHGHDEGAREAVARFFERLGFEAIILHEQANQGRTVIEKVEEHGDVGYAVVLLTPDDEGAKKGEIPRPRARQNVIMELGYFVGRLGRKHVCALTRGDIEIPSDFGGVVYEQFDAAGGWKQALGRELHAAGFDIDWNKVMRP